MHSTAVKLVASRAVARSPGQRIIGGMVGRPRPSPLDGKTALGATSVISKVDYTALESSPLETDDDAVIIPDATNDMTIRRPTGGKVVSQVPLSRPDNFWDDLLRPDEISSTAEPKDSDG